MFLKLPAVFSVYDGIVTWGGGSTAVPDDSKVASFGNSPKFDFIAGI